MSKYFCWAPDTTLEDQNGRRFARIQRFHEILFILSLIVVFVSAAGAHGLF